MGRGSLGHEIVEGFFTVPDRVNGEVKFLDCFDRDLLIDGTAIISLSSILVAEE